MSGALQRALQRPKWSLTQLLPDDRDPNVELATATRTTNRGFVDNVSIRVLYDHPIQGHATVVANSQCSNPNHSYDWGQNKRNLNQLKAAIEEELYSTQAHPALSPGDEGQDLGASLMAGNTLPDEPLV